MSTKQYYTCLNGSPTVKEATLQPLKPGHVRVLTKSVGINPIDLFHLLGRLADGLGAGSDFSGTVTEVADDVTSFKAGDFIAGAVVGGDIDDPEQGAYSSYVDILADTAFKFEDLQLAATDFIDAGPISTFEQAAAVPLILHTAASTVSVQNGLPLEPNVASGYCLIYGAGTGVGFSAVQLAAYMGYTVIATAAPKHHDLLKSVGAKFVVDYHGDWVQKTREIAGDSIQIGIDTVSKKDTWDQVQEAVSHNLPAKIHNVQPALGPPTSLRSNVTWHNTDVYWLFVGRKQFGPKMFEGVPEILAKRPLLSRQLRQFMSTGGYKAPTVHVVGHGFSKVPALYSALKEGASGNKFVLDF